MFEHTVFFLPVCHAAFSKYISGESCTNRLRSVTIKNMAGFLQKIFGSKNERELKRLFNAVDKVNSLEPSVSSLSDTQLKAKTEEFKKEAGIR